MDSKIYISTDLDQIQKVVGDLKVAPYASGRLYFAEYENGAIGCITLKTIEGVPAVELPPELFGKFVSCSVDFKENTDKRLNVPGNWTSFPSETIDNTAFINFVNAQDKIFVEKNRLPGGYCIKNRYDITTQSELTSDTFNLDEYEKIMNRYVVQYNLFGLKNNVVTKAVAEWYNEEALALIESKFDTAIKAGFSKEE